MSITRCVCAARRVDHSQHVALQFEVVSRQESSRGHIWQTFRWAGWKSTAVSCLTSWRIRSPPQVRAIVTMAGDLGIDTVAEYAETEPIIQRLRELGVEYAQG